MIFPSVIAFFITSLASSTGISEQNAYESSLETLAKDSCNEEALRVLEITGKKWIHDDSKKQEKVLIYERLTECHPNNPDYLYYYGRALYQVGKLEESEMALNRCLTLAPQYVDAELLLGYIALQRGELQKARSIFETYSNNPDALAALKSLRQKERAIRLTNARIAQESLNYDQAEQEYAWMIQDDSNSFPHWPAVFKVKSHTRPSFQVISNYTDAKEDDPSVGKPVVKDYYFLNKAILKIPIFNRWRISLNQLYYHQRENDIYPPIGVNYSAYSVGGEFGSEVFFAKYWRWDLSLRAFRMWGEESVNFPFHNTTRFEPGTTFFYNDGTYIGALNAHRESYIIKNFDRGISELLATDFLTGVFAYRMGEKVKFECSGKIDQVFIHDSLHNWANDINVTSTLSLPIPRLWKYWTVLYHFQHEHFNKLNQNYYSFNHQLRNTLGIRLRLEFTKMIYWESTYEHRWQMTYQLFQPIGNLLFIANKQYLIGNRVTSKIGAQYKDRLKFEIEGHYFYDTLPYRDWNLNGSLVWQF